MMGRWLYCKIEYLDILKDNKFNIIDYNIEFNLSTTYFMDNLNNDGCGDSFDWFFDEEDILPEGDTFCPQSNGTIEYTNFIKDLSKIFQTQNNNQFSYTFDKFKQLSDTLSKEYYSRRIYQRKKKNKESLITTKDYRNMYDIIQQFNLILLNILNDDHINTDLCRIIFWFEDN